jgi:hypothetical protein
MTRPHLSAGPRRDTTQPGGRPYSAISRAAADAHHRLPKPSSQLAAIEPTSRHAHRRVSMRPRKCTPFGRSGSDVCAWTPEPAVAHASPRVTRMRPEVMTVLPTR